jgi:glycerol-3-phosphate dehydrogenase
MATRVLLRRLAIAGGLAGAGGGGLSLGLSPAAPSVDDLAVLAAAADSVPTRAEQLSALRRRGATADAADPARPELDVLIIGGGATGCASALDASLRGLKVALVERDDFASGTSSRSTKLIHGGVRYLEKAFFQLDPGQLKLVFEALHERAIMLKQAPHLTQPLPTLLPCYKLWEVPFYWVGLKAYDLVAAVGSGLLYMSKYVSAGEAMRQFPTLSHKSFDGEKLRGSIMYYDGQMDDARFNVGLALTASLYGASVANHTEVVGLLRAGMVTEGAEEAPVVGARLRDMLTGEEFEVRAKAIINATGPFTDAVRKMEDGNANPMIVPSAGVHVTLPSYYSPEGMGLIVPKTKDGRVVFMLPWLGRTIAGTTDSSTEITALPQPHEDEVTFILDALADYLRIEVRAEDVQSAWSGIRPLAVDPDADPGSTQNILREHAVHVSPAKVVTITGGKWTTQRAMGEAAVDKAIEVAGLGSKATNCKTTWVKLIGGHKWDNSNFTFLSQHYKVDVETSKHLSRAYGDQAYKVAELAEEKLGKRLVPGLPVIEAEVVYCVRQEYCMTATDFLARRSRLAFLDVKGARKALPRVVDLMAEELDWSRGRKAQEISAAEKLLDSFSSSKTHTKA